MLDMIKCSTGGAYYARGEWVPADGEASAALAAKGFDAAAIENAKTGTMAYSILQAHNTSGDAENLKIKFDAMASHDITFVGIIQTARASGLEKFPIPYVLTNCHNSLCAVGGTINEDDHRFGLSAAKKYGGIFVPPHLAVIHQYMREKFAGCGKMILGSDSHTRYGALGTMAIGEGGGVIAGCAGGLYDSIYEAASILKGHTGGCGDYALSVYPGSQPIMMELVRTGVIHDLMASGATVRTAFCGPCFGAGDVPANGALSIRHTTRNFPSREGSKPGNGQLSGVALMDARSIAATTANGGILTPATDIDYDPTVPEYQYDPSSYDTRVYQGFGKGDYDALLKLGPNIKDWPEIAPLGDNLLLKVASYITDPVTTTDELIPSGETSSYRSNPLGLAEFTLSRKDPEYVGRAKAVQAEEKARRAGEGSAEVLAQLHKVPGCENLTWNDVQIASTIFAVKPGDGSAREQAASCQRVLGAGANIVTEYATKRYRSNLINWGMLPLQLVGATPFGLGDYVFIPNVREALKGDLQDIKAYVLGDTAKEFSLYMAPLTADERKILADGCLINFYKH